MFYGVRWINCLYNSLLGLISIPVVFLMIVVMVYNVCVVGVIGDKIDIDGVNIISSFDNIIMISGTNFFINGVRFKLGMGP